MCRFKGHNAGYLNPRKRYSSGIPLSGVDCEIDIEGGVTGKGKTTLCIVVYYNSIC